LDENPVRDFYLFSGSNVPDQVQAEIRAAGDDFLASSTAYMTKATWHTYVLKFLLPQLATYRTTAQIAQDQWLVVLLDGLKAHRDDVDVLQACRQHHVLLFSMPPHTSHLLQPLDVGVFSGLKRAFKRQAAISQESRLEPLTPWDIPEILRAVRVKSMSNGTKACDISWFLGVFLSICAAVVLKSAFRHAGVHPVNLSLATDLARRGDLLGSKEAMGSDNPEELKMFNTLLLTVPGDFDSRFLAANVTPSRRAEKRPLQIQRDPATSPLRSNVRKALVTLFNGDSEWRKQRRKEREDYNAAALHSLAASSAASSAASNASTMPEVAAAPVPASPASSTAASSASAAALPASAVTSASPASAHPRMGQATIYTFESDPDCDFETCDSCCANNSQSHIDRLRAAQATQEQRQQAREAKAAMEKELFDALALLQYLKRTAVRDSCKLTLAAMKACITNSRFNIAVNSIDRDTMVSQLKERLGRPDCVWTAHNGQRHTSASILDNIHASSLIQGARLKKNTSNCSSVSASDFL